jgi:hypothetical protein
VKGFFQLSSMMAKTPLDIKRRVMFVFQLENNVSSNRLRLQLIFTISIKASLRTLTILI